jgi:hypothetical protein
MKDFAKICMPARIYFAIAMITTIFALFNGFSMIYAFWKILFAFIWTFVLSFLCDKGYTSISWFLVLLPYIFILLAVLNIYHITQEQKQLMSSQGPYIIEGMKNAEKRQTAITRLEAIKKCKPDKINEVIKLLQELKIK